MQSALELILSCSPLTDDVQEKHVSFFARVQVNMLQTPSVRSLVVQIIFFFFFFFFLPFAEPRVREED